MELQRQVVVAHVERDRVRPRQPARQRAQVVALEAVSGARNYPALVESLRDATPVLESFFDGENSVMVMSEDLDVRKNRLNLLSVFRNQALVLADFSVMQSR